MDILVTGATGFIGKALTTRLVADPANRVAILVRDQYRQEVLPRPLDSLSDRLVTLYADLRDYHATRRAVQAIRPQIIYHLAASGVSDPFLDVDAALEQNLFGTLNLVRAAFEEEHSPFPDQLLVVRTPGECSAMNPYAASKAAAWQLCAMYARTRGWPIIGVMPFQTYGPGQHSRHLVSGALAAAIADQDFDMTSGQQVRDWIYIGDVVEGVLAAANASLAPGTSVQLGTGRLTSVADVVRMIYDLVGGVGQPRLGALPSRSGEEPEQVADTGRMHALTGWEAGVTLEQGLARTYDHFRRRLA